MDLDATKLLRILFHYEQFLQPKKNIFKENKTLLN